MQKKSVDKVTTGTVKRKTRSAGKKFSDLFFCEDIPNVKEYLVYDLLIPSVKDLFWGTLKNAIDMLAYGKIQGNRNSSGVFRSAGNQTNYGAFSRPNSTPRSRLMYTFDDIYCDSSSDAQDALDVLQEMIETYGEVTVKDYYDAMGVSSNSYTDNNYGWTNLNGARVIRTREGYQIDMPRCQQLGRR